MTRHLVALALLLATSCSRFSRPEAEEWQPNAIHWDHMPITVSWDHDSFPDYNDGINAAIALWNKEIGCTVFHVVDDENADVLIGSRGEFYGSPSPQRDAWADTTYLPAVSKAEIRLLQFGTIQAMYVVAMHELGHVLGLAHDSGGIMSPQIGDFNLPTVFVPDRDDVRRVRARYCR